MGLWSVIVLKSLAVVAFVGRIVITVYHVRIT